MKYTVCYTLYCSREVEANTAADAADVVFNTVEMPDDADDMEVSLITDEDGNPIIH